VNDKIGFLVFRKDNESVINVRKLMQLCPKVLEITQLPLEAQMTKS
jgi:hypothetical protein